MEYRMELNGQAIGLENIREAILGSDPAALVDLDPKGSALLLATFLNQDALAGLLVDAGLPTTAAQLVRAPSVCCGGCGG